MGSDTNPPCEEDVFRFIMKKPLVVTPSQLDAIENNLYRRDVDFNGNVREIQKSNGRFIYFQNDTHTECDGLGRHPYDALDFVRSN